MALPANSLFSDRVIPISRRVTVLNKNAFSRRVVYFLFLLLVLFPYISPISTGTDMQPWVTLLACFLVPCFRFRLLKHEFMLLVLVVVAFLILVSEKISFLSLRSFYNYLNLFLVSYVSFRVLKSELIKIEDLLKGAVVVWVFAGLIQMLFGSSMFSFLLPNMRTTDNRGVTSLAPEPTFYGIILVFFILFFMQLNVSNKKAFIALSVFGVVVIAQSSMAILFLSILMFYLAVTHFKIRWIFFSILSLISFPLLVDFFAPESRMATLLGFTDQGIFSVMVNDASVNDRFFHIFLSFKGFLESYFLPNGYSEWLPYASSQMRLYSGIINAEYFSMGGRIMSGYGASLFELGFWGLIIPSALCYLIWNLYRADIKKVIFYSFFVNTLMLAAIPVGFSYFAFYFAFLSYLRSVQEPLLER